MDKAEALELLRRHLASWRTQSYQDLAGQIGETHSFEATGSSGAQYQGSIQVFWDGPPNGDIRVMGSIDDGGWRAFVPLTDAFIMASNGTFVGE